MAGYSVITVMAEKNKIQSLLILLRNLCLACIVTVLIIKPEKGYAQTPHIRYAEFNHDSDSIGIHGYDPVSYFTGNPENGSESIRFNFNGIIYRFISESNRKKFREAPEKYEPEYGGWCAYAMGKKGEKVDINPLTFKILNGKLYLFYNKYFTNTLNVWNKDETAMKHSADINWGRIINK